MFKSKNLVLRCGTAALFFLMVGALSAQVRYGFKTGLNFAHISGPSELDDAGNSLESWKSITGFHIGLALSYPITDYLGVRAELLYSKKGGKYTFNGPSYRIFRYSGGSTYSTGNSRYLINVNNAYLDLPLMVYGRWKDLELSAGGYVSLLVQSVGDGSITYSGGRTELQNGIDTLEFNLDYNFRKDAPGGGDNGSTVVAKVDGKTLSLPKTLGAYYDYPEDKGSLFNAVDYGIVVGLNYYLSRSLFAGIRLQYGLSDVTSNKADLAKARTAADHSLLYRGDKDRNMLIQASVGFSF